MRDSDPWISLQPCSIWSHRQSGLRAGRDAGAGRRRPATITRLRDVPVPELDALAERLADRRRPATKSGTSSRPSGRWCSSTIPTWKSRSSTTARPTARARSSTGWPPSFRSSTSCTLTELPAGWLGKNHALQLGADRSRGEWLLFTDADIVFEPTALRRAIGYAPTNTRRSPGGDARRAHALVAPARRSSSRSRSTFRSSSASGRSAIRKSQAHVGIGAFNLVRADVYRAVGGHERIRMRPDDDLKLGKIIKLAGYRQDVVHGIGMIAVEWYASRWAS